MRNLTTLAAAAAFSISGFAVQAGSLDPVDPLPPVDPPVVGDGETGGSSINSTFVIVGVLAALLIAAAVNAQD